MLDPKFIRENTGLVRKSLQDRNYDQGVLDSFLELDGRWRALTEEGNELRRHRNEVSEQIPKLAVEENVQRSVR